MNEYEVRVYNTYQELVYRSLPSSLNFAISKVADYSKDETNSIYINNTHTGENYDYIWGNKSTKVKTVKKLEIEFEIKRKKCNDEIDNIVYLLAKYKYDTTAEFTKIKMDLEYNLKMKMIEYSKF